MNTFIRIPGTYEQSMCFQESNFIIYFPDNPNMKGMRREGYLHLNEYNKWEITANIKEAYKFQEYKRVLRVKKHLILPEEKIHSDEYLDPVVLQLNEATTYNLTMDFNHD